MSSNRIITDEEEMVRRWKALLPRMEEEHIDCLFSYSTDRVASGYLRYLTDFPTLLYPISGMFSKKGVSMVGHGAKDSALYPANIRNHNVIDCLTVPWMPTSLYAETLIPEKLAELISKYSYKKVGMVGMGVIPALFTRYFDEHLSGVQFVDATSMVDEVKAVKSPYELRIAQKCVWLIDEVMAAIPSVLKVGVGIRDAGKKLRHLADDLDCLNVNILIGKHPTMPLMSLWEFIDNEVLQPEDSVSIMVEVSSPEGFWAETARIYSMGEPNERLAQIVNDAFEFQDFIAGKLVPGAIASSVYRQYCELLISRGYPPEKRFCAHGQGYDVMESPFVRPENDEPLKEGMFVAIHPTPVLPDKKTGCFVCDNYVVTQGGARRLSKTPSEIIRVYNR